VIRELLEQRAGEDYDLYARAINPQFMKVLRTIGFDRVWQRAEGQYLYDSDGNRYLDFLGGFGMFNVGRNNARVRAALVEALELATPGSVQLGVSLLPGLLAEELLRRTPPRLARVLFTNSGTEATEAALKLGRAATGRSRVLSETGGFHGLTLGSLSASGDRHFTERFEPLLPGFEHVRRGDLDALEAQLRREDVALFLVEPVQGHGLQLAPDGYFARAQELCRAYGTLFAVDEVQTGLGRTGKLFAFEHWGLEPDLVTIAKSLSGGYVPVGALLMSERVYDGVFDSLEHSVSHGSTFAPNDLAMAAGLATLRELDEARLVTRLDRRPVLNRLLRRIGVEVALVLAVDLRREGLARRAVVGLDRCAGEGEQLRLRQRAAHADAEDALAELRPVRLVDEDDDVLPHCQSSHLLLELLDGGDDHAALVACQERSQVIAAQRALDAGELAGGEGLVDLVVEVAAVDDDEDRRVVEADVLQLPRREQHRQALA
jgi:acetylornithine/succinyldiaminopimelate/putrescine aminotransferase